MTTPHCEQVPLFVGKAQTGQKKLPIESDVGVLTLLMPRFVRACNLTRTLELNRAPLLEQLSSPPDDSTKLALQYGQCIFLCPTGNQGTETSGHIQ
jgi:hypothetical protein